MGHKAIKKICFSLLLLSALAGCQPSALSEREIARGVFFQREGQQTKVTLLLLDQNTQGEEQSYKVVSGTGRTPAQALGNAERELDGTIFYGLLDLVVVPAEAKWDELAEITETLYRTVQPAPEITLFALRSAERNLNGDNAGETYDAMKRVEKRERIHCGLQQLCSNETCCALPVWEENSYSMMVDSPNGEQVFFREPMAAQLLAGLCSMTDKFRFGYGGGTAACDARFELQFEAIEKTTVQVRLLLERWNLKQLTAADAEKKFLQEILATELRQCFSSCMDVLEKAEMDVASLRFWQASVYGDLPQPPDAQLEVLFANR